MKVQIQLRCYPKEFIFAEKLETVIYCGGANSRMNDFHDLHSLISIPGCLNTTDTEKVIINVFKHRQTSIQNLPLHFDPSGMAKLQSLWNNYLQELKPSVSPSSFEEVTFTINHWLETSTRFCASNSYG